MTRDRLPNRRKSSLRDFEHGGMKFSVCCGLHDDGRIGEVFISSGKPGSDLGSLVGDAAICISLALQHGASLDDIRHALQRDKGGSPASVLGSALATLSVIPISKG